MKYHIQEILNHDEPAGKGSCYPTAIACLLDLPLNRVPYFNLMYWSEDDRNNFIKFLGSFPGMDEGVRTSKLSQFEWLWWNTLTWWLAAQGYKIEFIDREYRDEWTKNNPLTPYMVSGKTVRGTMHVVIYQDGKMIHDPHPSGDGLLEEENMEVLVKI